MEASARGLIMLDTEHAIVQSARGVIAPPPTFVPLDIHRLVAQELAKEPQAINGVVLTVDLKAGVNLVLAHRTPSGWELDVFAGSRWDGDLNAGVRVAKRW